MPILFQPAWADQLQQASFRGIPFGVFDDVQTISPRLANHQYPGLDGAYLENLGQQLQEITFRAFLNGDSVFQQRDALEAALLIPGAGPLIHPNLGLQMATLMSASFAGRVEESGMLTVELRFGISSGIQFPTLYPLVGTNSLSEGPQSALNLIGAAVADFESVISTVAGVATMIASAIAPFAGLISFAAGIALQAVSAVKGISLGQPGWSLGRYANGNITNVRTPPGTAPQSITSTVNAIVSQALSTACTARASVATAISAMTSLGAADDPDFAQSVSDTIEAARSVIVDPADQIQALLTLCKWQPNPVLPAISPISQQTSQVSVATGSLCRRMALASLANACVAYNATSSTAVQGIIGLILPLFDGEILNAGDIGDLASYQALRSLKTQTISNLQAEAANLPALITIKLPTSLPSLVVSYRLYGDATRNDELVAQADPANPLFMPRSFQALSA